MTTLNRRTEKWKRMNYLVIISCLAVLIVSGCGGAMVNVKQAFDANPKMIVAEFPKDQTSMGLLVPGRENARAARGLAQCASVVNCLVESRPMPAAYRDIAEVVAEEARAGLGKPDIKYAKGMNIPMKQNVIGPDTPDWNRTDFDLVMQPTIGISYNEVISNTSTAPFSYSLDGTVTLTIKRKDAKGDWDVVKPNMFGYVTIASVSKKLDMSSATYKTIEQLQEMMPATAIVNELREKTREGMKKFIAEMKAAK